MNSVSSYQLPLRMCKVKSSAEECFLVLSFYPFEAFVSGCVCECVCERERVNVILSDL